MKDCFNIKFDLKFLTIPLLITFFMASCSDTKEIESNYSNVSNRFITEISFDITNLNIDYILEPNQEEIVTQLIPKSIKIQLYKAVLDSHASEHGARMTSMDKATENAGDLIKSLKLAYNQARQAAITTELTEIVSGAAALNG